MSLKDGSLAYVSRRFDRLPNGRKLPQEDFCQLSLKSPKEKYDGTAELCVGLLRKYASEPLIEMLKLYRQLVFAWWTFNGDMHLKNFSLLTDRQGYTRLTPAYDLACTRLVVPNDTSSALPIRGKRDNLKRTTWLAFAEYCELPEKTAQRVLEKLSSVLDEALALIERSFLLQEQKEQYQQHVAERGAQLLQ